MTVSIDPVPGAEPADKPAVLLVHHAANRGPLFPPGSPAGLRACLAAGARAIEIDLSATSDGQLVLLHGPNLESETDGTGPIAATTAHHVAGLYYAWQGAVTGQPVGLLDQALELLATHSGPIELQLDLKAYSVLPPPLLARFVDQLRPVRDRVRVTSTGDWLLRSLSALDPALPLGFDPLLYLDLPRPGPILRPPFRQGAYGYLDDHPLASQRWGDTAAYAAARAEALWVQAPAGATWYINAWLLARLLDEGWDWIAYLHRRGAEVAGWTLDEADIDLARRLVEQGIDRIITNNPPALAQRLAGRTVF